MLFQDSGRRGGSRVHGLVGTVRGSNGVIITVNCISGGGTSATSVSECVVLSESVIGFLNEPGRRTITSGLSRQCSVMVSLAPSIYIPLMCVLSLARCCVHYNGGSDGHSKVCSFMVSLPTPPVSTRAKTVSLTCYRTGRLNRRVVGCLQRVHDQ